MKHGIALRKINRQEFVKICKTCRNYYTCKANGVTYVYFSLIGKSGLKCSSKDGRMLEWVTLDDAKKGIRKLSEQGEIELQVGDSIQCTCNKQIRIFVDRKFVLSDKEERK